MILVLACVAAPVTTPASGSSTVLISDMVNNGDFDRTNAPGLLWTASPANRSYSLVVGVPPGTPSEAGNNSAVYGVASGGVAQGLAMDTSLSATGYTIGLGDRYDLQFRVISVSEWEAAPPTRPSGRSSTPAMTPSTTRRGLQWESPLPARGIRWMSMTTIITRRTGSID